MTKIISNLEVTQLVVDNPIGQDNPPMLFLPTLDNGAKPPSQHVLNMSDFDVN